MILSIGVKWYLLISEMEAFKRETGWGLAACWSHVNKNEYELARKRMDDLLGEVNQ